MIDVDFRGCVWISMRFPMTYQNTFPGGPYMVNVPVWSTSDVPYSLGFPMGVMFTVKSDAIRGAYEGRDTVTKSVLSGMTAEPL